MARQLKELAVPPEEQCLLPIIHRGALSQPSTTPVPGNLMPSFLASVTGHCHNAHTYMQTNTHKNKVSNAFKKKPRF